MMKAYHATQSQVVRRGDNQETREGPYHCAQVVAIPPGRHNLIVLTTTVRAWYATYISLLFLLN